MSLDRKIGVAISVFNKVEEVSTNVNIIRKHWKCNNNAFISICCNDPLSIEKIRTLDVDAVALGDNIPSSPKPNLRRRQFDCIKKSFTNNKADYVVHWHADAFALDGHIIEEHYNKMQNNNFEVSFRGRGLDYRSDKNLYGDVDDHFLFLSNKAINSKIFNIDPNVYVQSCNVESFLSYMVKTTFDSSKIWHYDDMSQNLIGDDSKTDSFYSDNIQHRAMNPFNIDESRLYIHAQTKELIKDKLLRYGVSKDIIDL